MTRLLSVFEVATLVGTLTGCLAGEPVDLGTNLRPIEPDATATVVLEAGIDASVDDAPAAEDVPPIDDAPLDATDESEADAPAIVGNRICIPNPSFEVFSGDASTSPLLTNPQNWQVCSGAAVQPQACTLPPAEGNTYLALSIGLAPLIFDPTSVDSFLCDPLETGVTYSLSVELALDAPQNDADPPGEPPALQLRGSTTACDPQADLLARFSGATNICSWKQLCATFVAQKPYSHLILIPEATSSTGLVYYQTNMLVDDLVSGGSCSRR